MMGPQHAVKLPADSQHVIKLPLEEKKVVLLRPSRKQKTDEPISEAPDIHLGIS